MSERSEIEQELMDASKFKAKNYPDRQDELAALVRACERMPDTAFDTLSEEAAGWYNKAATAMNDHDDIPEFEESDNEETSADTDHEADEAAEDAAAEDDAEDDEDEDADDSDVNEGSIEEDEVEPPKKKRSFRVSEESQREDDEAEEKAKPAKAAKGKRKVDTEVDPSPEQLDDEEATKKPAKKAKTAKAVAAPEPDEEVATGSDDDEAPTPKLKKPKAPINKGRTRTPYDNLTGEKDRFGLYYGTKTQQAAEFYARPEGATSKYVEMELAGRHRNILVRLAKDGHRVEKHDGGVFKLIHRDDIGKEPIKAKKAKK